MLTLGHSDQFVFIFCISVSNFLCQDAYSVSLSHISSFKFGAYVLCFLHFSDDHGFIPLHWACREGQMVIFEMLVARGARLNAKNHGGDSPLHLASAHGHRDIVQKVGSKKQ